MKAYNTSDMPFAAYLMLQDYTCLGTVRTADDFRCEFVLVNTNFDDYNDMRDDILKHQEKFHTESKGFREYYSKIKLCRRKLENPLSNDQVEV